MKFVKTISGKKLVNLSFVKFIYIEKDRVIDCCCAQYSEYKEVWDVVLVVDDENVFVSSRHTNEEDATYSLNNLLSELME
jgi:hypothetical protein